MPYFYCKCNVFVKRLAETVRELRFSRCRTLLCKCSGKAFPRHCQTGRKFANRRCHGVLAPLTFPNNRKFARYTSTRVWSRWIDSLVLKKFYRERLLLYYRRDGRLCDLFYKTFIVEQKLHLTKTRKKKDKIKKGSEYEGSEYGRDICERERFSLKINIIFSRRTLTNQFYSKYGAYENIK